MNAQHSVDKETSEYAQGEPRVHPWTVTTYGDREERYIDLKADPGKALEAAIDFLPWMGHRSAVSFVELLQHVNREGALFETNDCAFHGPSPNTHGLDTPKFMQEKALQCSGRVMVLYRHLPWNVSAADWLLGALVHYLQAGPVIEYAAVLACRFPTTFLELERQGEPASGHEIELEFWAWGDTDAEAMRTLGHVFDGIRHALDQIEREIHDATAAKSQDV